MAASVSSPATFGGGGPLPFTGIHWLDVTLTLWLIFGAAAGLLGHVEESHPFLPVRWWVIALKVALPPLAPLIGRLTRRREV
jgi:hypothetical protein